MESSIKKQYSVCLLWRFLIKLGNYEPGLFNLVLDFTTTITIKTNDDLQIKIDTFFKNCGEGYETFGCISLWNVFAIKQINVVFPRRKCCMEDGFKIKNWVCQKEPKKTYSKDYWCSCSSISGNFMMDLYEFEEFEPKYDSMDWDWNDWNWNDWNTISITKKKERNRTTRYINSIINEEEHKYKLQFRDKKFKRQRDRITRYINKTSPKIKSSKIQIGKR